MKYLKPFNESVENDIKSDIEDILTELIDDGFRFKISDKLGWSDHSNEDKIIVDIFKTDKYGFIYLNNIFNDVKEVILRLTDYMNDQGYINYYFRLNGAKQYLTIDEYEKKINNNDDNYSSLIIIFTK